jgi:hypothetical protein
MNKRTWRLIFNTVLIVALLGGAISIFAQSAATKRLDVAVNGFELNEAAAQDALEAGADINWQNDAMSGETMLITAIKGFKEPKVVKFLLENGADPNIKDDTGKTALQWARQYNIGRDRNGREILKMLEDAVNKKTDATDKNVEPEEKPTTQNKTAKTTERKTAATKTAPNRTPTTRRSGNAPTADEIKAMLEEKFTSIYEDHFGGTEKAAVEFEWLAPVTLGAQIVKGEVPVKCWAAKIDVKVTFTKPSSGETSWARRGVNGDPVKEGFCIYRDAFDQWTYLTYAP